MRSAIRTPTVPVLTVLVALSAATLPWAQEPAAPRAQEAHVPKPRELEIPVSGLQSENVAGVRADLLALEMQVHHCKACEKEQPRPGVCPSCKGPLEAETRPLLTGVVIGPGTNQLTLTTDPMALVRLSEVETVLTKRSVRIDDERFALPGRAQLVVACPPTEATAVERALKDAKLFVEVKVEPEASADQLVLTVRGDAKAPSRAKVITALRSAKAQLVDIVWRPVVTSS